MLNVCAVSGMRRSAQAAADDPKWVGVDGDESGVTTRDTCDEEGKEVEADGHAADSDVAALPAPWGNTEKLGEDDDIDSDDDDASGTAAACAMGYSGGYSGTNDDCDGAVEKDGKPPLWCDWAGLACCCCSGVAAC